MDKWINNSSLAALKQELAEHRQALPLYREQLSAYHDERRELLARLELHLHVLRDAKAKARRLP